MDKVSVLRRLKRISVQIERQKLLGLYTGIFSILGIIIFLCALFYPHKDIWGLAVFVVLSAIAELFSVELFRTTRNSSISVSMIIAISCILVYGPLDAAFTHAVSGWMTAITMTILRPVKNERRRTSWFQRSAFNAGMYACSTYVAGCIYVILGGKFGENVLNLMNIIPLFLAVATQVFINIFILMGVINLQTDRKISDLWEQDFKWSVPINVLGGFLGGGMLGLAHYLVGFMGLVVFFLPVITTGYSFRIYVTNTKQYVNQLEELNEKLNQTNINLLGTLGAVIDAYDVFTYGHSTQVAVYSGEIAKRMGLSKEIRKKIVRAALIHDIGKIGIPESIISKPGKLTEEEVQIIRHHPLIGAQILQKMEGLQELVPLVRHHHERWDGKGYPSGLLGEEIPVETRILSLADALDAIYSDRPYHRKKNYLEVKKEIIRCTGQQFAPSVVKTFLELVEEQGDAFFKNSATMVDGIDLIHENVNYFMKKSWVDEYQKRLECEKEKMPIMA